MAKTSTTRKTSSRKTSKRRAETKPQRKTKTKMPKKTKRASSAEKKQRKPKVKKDKRDDVAVVLQVEEDLNALFNSISKELLVELLQCNNIKVNKTSKKKDVLQQIMDLASQRGHQIVLDRMSKSDLSSAIKSLKSSEAEHPNNKGELQKELKNQMDSAGGFEKALPKYQESLIDSICESLGFKEEGDKSDKIDGLSDEARIQGAKTLFDHTLVTFMREVCDKCGLSTRGKKEHLVARFLGQAYRFMLNDAKVPEREKKEEKGKKEKGKKREKVPGPDIAKIKKGITSEELHQYYAKDLAKYVDEHHLRKGKNQRDCVKIILAFLAGDVEGTKRAAPGSGKGKRKRGRKGGKGKQPSKKAKTS